MKRITYLLLFLFTLCASISFGQVTATQNFDFTSLNGGADGQDAVTININSGGGAITNFKARITSNNYNYNPHILRITAPDGTVYNLGPAFDASVIPGPQFDSGVISETGGNWRIDVFETGGATGNLCRVAFEYTFVDTPPTAVCANFTAQLDGSGNVTIAGTDVDGGSSDAEGAVTLSVSPSTFTCANLGANTVTLTVTDSAGQTATCTATVTVEDNQGPVFANIAGSGTLADPFLSIDPAVTGSVPSGVYYFNYNGSTFQAELDNATHGGGWLMILNYVHLAGDNSVLQVRNTDLPLLGASTLGTSEAASASWGHFGNTLAAAIDFEEMRFYAQTSRDPNDIIDFTTNYTNAVNYAKTGVGSFSGIINPANYTLGGAHAASIPQNAPNFFTNQGDFALTNFPFWRSGQAHWGIRGLGNRWEVDDFAVNTFSTIHRMWVRGDLSPTLNNVTLTVQLDAAGNVTVAPGDFGITATDNCGVATLSLSQTAFTCAEVGSNTIQLTATDALGNASTIDVTLIVEDVTPPTVVTQDLTVQLDAAGQVTVLASAIDNGSSDACGIATIAIAEIGTAFAEVNENQTLTITAPAGTVITSVDFASYGTPTGSNGMYTIGACHEANSVSIVEGVALGNNSFTIAATNATFGDPCFGTQKRLFVAVTYSSPAAADVTFTCADLGPNVVNLVVTDVNGNSATAPATITVEDTLNPAITCPGNITQNSDTGICGAAVTWTAPVGTDNCTGAITTSTHNPGDIFVVGTTTVTYTVTDASGNIAMCSFDVTVNDTELPVIVCPADITVNNDPGVCGAVVTWTAPVGTDNCTGAVTTSTHNPGDSFIVGTTTVTYTVTDASGNTAMCSFDVTVVDNEPPVAVCMNIDAFLDASGSVTITAADVDGGSTDNCGIASIAIDIDTFTCDADLGPNDVTLTVTDVNGNISTCIAVVTVIDDIDPTIACPASQTADTDPGLCTAVVIFPDAIALDNCTVTVAQTGGLPSGSPFPVGVNTIEYTATDSSGNTAICTFTITVTDNELPVAVCQDITIQLDANGDATITAADIDGGSTDNCGIASIDASQTVFDCSDVGANDITLTVTDVNGNVSTCIAIVTVEDNVDPVAVCVSITVELDINGTVTITPADIDGGSSDACGIASLELDVDTFTCAEVGENTVTLTVTDNNGNVTSCTAIVTVEDNIDPDLVCMDITVELDENGEAEIVPEDVMANNTDACGIMNTGIDIFEFDCDDIGTPVTVTVFSQDNNGNLSSCMAVVTVIDALAPVVTCPADITVDPGAGNQFYLVPDYFALGEATATDNCTDPLTIFGQDPAPGTLLPDGVYTVTMSATDESGNVGTCTFELTVESILGVDDNGIDISTIVMYPNPATTEVRISNPQSIVLEEATFFDITGRKVATYDLRDMGTDIGLDISTLATAAYTVVIKGPDGQINKRLIKE